MNFPLLFENKKQQSISTKIKKLGDKTDRLNLKNFTKLKIFKSEPSSFPLEKIHPCRCQNFEFLVIFRSDFEYPHTIFASAFSGL